MTLSVADPLERFEEEHRHALRELDRLEAAGLALSSGVRPDEQIKAIRLAHEFLTSAVRAHNDNEERALFPFLGEEAPTALFEEEHVTLRGLERELGRALDRDDRAGIPSIAHSIVDLLRAHIHREDEALFPMARAMLGPEGLRLVAQRLAEAE